MNEKELMEFLDKQLVEHVEFCLRDKGIDANVWWENEGNQKIMKIEILWGDWKHDHLLAKYVVEDGLGIVVQRWETDVTEEDGSDCYSAIHTLWLGEKVERNARFVMNEILCG